MHDADDDNFSCQMHCDLSSPSVTCCASRKFHAQQSSSSSFLSIYPSQSPFNIRPGNFKPNQATTLTRHLSFFPSLSLSVSLDKSVLDAPVANLNDSPGELGKPVILPKDMPIDMKKAVDDGWTKNAFNQYVSDLISVHRSLPDPRDAWCKDSARYLSNLPKTDVIICFHNEAWSVLLRTVHSVLDRSPPELIGQIILVDDYSDMRELLLFCEGDININGNHRFCTLQHISRNSWRIISPPIPWCRLCVDRNARA